MTLEDQQKAMKERFQKFWKNNVRGYRRTLAADRRVLRAGLQAQKEGKDFLDAAYAQVYIEREKKSRTAIDERHKGVSERFS